MAQPNDPYKLMDSWRALSGNADGDGWRTIPLDLLGNCLLMAGRYYPDDAEAVLIGFQSVIVPANKYLPQGQGFRVEKIKNTVTSGNRTWVSLSRLSGGSIDMFTVMVQDIVQTIYMHAQDSENSIFQIFLGRIRAWQSFMDKASVGILDIEAEIGLFGELTILENMLNAGMLPGLALDAWRGPLDGVHDFLVGNGGIEVKSTVAENSFLAKIVSLDQLDDTLIRPLYLAGVRLDLSELGVSLPEFIQNVRHHFDDDLASQNIYDCRLIQAGFLTSFSDRYTRRFRHIRTTVYEITNTFPRLTRNNVPWAILKGSYELDLNLIKGTVFGIDEVLEVLRGN